jgi:hypothetical protein
MNLFQDMKGRTIPAAQKRSRLYIANYEELTQVLKKGLSAYLI